MAKYNENVLARIEALLKRPERATFQFSGGKDSTFLIEHLLRVIETGGGDERPILVQTSAACEEETFNPRAKIRAAFADYFAEIRRRGDGRIVAQYVEPRVEDRFFATHIGRRYGYPNYFFRWCTGGLKEGPLRRAATSFFGRGVKKVVVTGRRKAESKARARLLTKFNPTDAAVYRWRGGAHSDPLFDVANEEVAAFGKRLDIAPCKAGRGGCWFCPFGASSVDHTPNYPETLRSFWRWLRETRSNLEFYEPQNEVQKEKIARGLCAGLLTIAACEEIFDRAKRAAAESGVEIMTPDEIVFIEKALTRAKKD